MIFAFNRKIYLGVLVCCLLSPLSAEAKSIKLKTYVKKYQKIEVSVPQQKNISKYKNLIKYYSSFAFFKPGRKVNVDFIKALMLAESNGDARAISSKGARGLCQIMYETGKIAARELTAKNIRFRHVNQHTLRNLQPDDLYQPAVNILLTCYLISKYNYKFDGKLDLVVSAWNAGENSIVNNRPPKYQETLNLIGKVNGYFIFFLNQKGRTQIAYRN